MTDTKTGGLSYGEIIIPEDVYVTVGRECNLWWSSIANVAEGDTSVYFETVCDIGINGTRGYRIAPNDNDVGVHSLRIVSRIRATREIVSDVTLNIHIVPENAGENKKYNVFMIGDSRTWQSYGGCNGYNFIKDGNKTVTTEVLALCDNTEGLKINTVGPFASEVNSRVRNMGGNGWTYDIPLQVFNGRVDDYLAENGFAKGEKLDVVTIMYGINDLSDWGNNVIGQFDNSLKKIPAIIENAKKLVDAILESYPETKIMMIVEPTTCGTQDGFGNWEYLQTNRQSHDEMELAAKVLRKEFLKTFEHGAYSKNIIVSNAGNWCDRLYGFPFKYEAESSRCARQKEAFIECVHPHDDGYKQIADGIFSTLKYIALDK